MRLAGKTAVIAGAAGGQGAAGALLFAREGADLALCDIDSVGLARVSDELAREFPDRRVLTRRVDLRRTAEIGAFAQKCVERFDAIDVVYNNAGVNHLQAIEDTADKDFDLVHDINLKASFFLVRYLLPGLRRSAGASIVNVSSGAGLLAPAPGNSLYCSSKGGLIALTKAQARDLAQFDIRVNCLLPGPIETPMVRGFFRSLPADERDRTRERVLARSLFQRFGRPEEVAAVALFLATDDAAYLTAAVIPVDAGWTAV
jgi:NAD(P)-dependent dehydrogenase (short-subunit alcohol dehydrogenase family)